jgi:citronellol/citronellal dehydrogenase
MQDVNVRGAFMLARACLPHLRAAENPHVLTLSPPLNLTSQLRHESGHAEPRRRVRRGRHLVDSLWPRTTIGTAAVRNLLGSEAAMARARRPEIMADAAYAILTSPVGHRSGRLLVNDEVLAEAGVTDLTPYSYSGADSGFDPDFFLRDPEPDELERMEQP